MPLRLNAFGAVGSESSPHMHGARRVFWITAGIALISYVATLSPSISLGMSGSLAVAADRAGVGNCPGFPLWTMVGWLFCRVFSFVTYLGHPNPAWALNLMSAVFASLSAGMVARIVVRLSQSDDDATVPVHVSILAVAAGLLLAWTPAVWRYAVITETMTFYLFFFTLLLASAVEYARTGAPRWLYAMSACFATNWLNGPWEFPMVFLFPAVIALRDRKLLAPFLATAAVALVAFYGVGHFTYRMEARCGACVGVGLVVAALFPQRGVLLRMAGAFLLAMLPWLYLPLASLRNPPMDWGVASTWEGFLHMLMRGQYEMPDWFACFRDPGRMGEHLRGLGGVAIQQLGIPALVAALLALCPRCLRDAGRGRLTVLAAIVFSSVALPLVGYESWDLQSADVLFRLWLPFLAALAVLAGTGIASAVSLPNRPRMAAGLALLAAVLLTAGPIFRGWFDEAYIADHGRSGQRGNDYGWQFGSDLLRGTGGRYPLPMEPGAIYFGGTDPGRFVIEYMTFSAGVRPDVFVITQNALADNTYMTHLRRFMGGRIAIPTQQEVNECFQQYVADVQAGKVPAGGDAAFEGGRVQVQGVGGVMAINGLIARRIFEANKAEHSFYMEESYVVPWMYPYLEPHGLIFRMRPEPLKELPPDLVATDRAFWDNLTTRLLADPVFLRDPVARRTYSKLRSANAGLYVARRNFAEGERGFRQAIELYPRSPEANFRLADALMQQFKFAEALGVIETYLRLDTRNTNVAAFRDQILVLLQQDVRRQELETLLAKGGDVDFAFELLELYRVMNLPERADSLADSIAAQSKLPPRYLLQLADFYKKAGRKDRRITLLVKYLRVKSHDLGRRAELAGLLFGVGRSDDGLREWKAWAVAARRSGGDSGKSESHR